MILGVALAMGSAANPFPCYAWGDLGHKIICQIAFQELNDRARAEVIRLVSLASNFEPSSPGTTGLVLLLGRARGARSCGPWKQEQSGPAA